MQPAHLSRERATGLEIDAGLRAHMNSVYNRMTLGILITAITGWVVAGSPFLISLFLGGPQAFFFIGAPLFIVWFGFNPQKMSSQTLMAVFVLLSFLYGVSFSVLALKYAGVDIARAFFVTAGLFAFLSILGYTTRINLRPLGLFCSMALLGILLVVLVNAFGGLMSGDYSGFSGTTRIFLDIAIVVAISGMTAWETQDIKQSYHSSYGREELSRLAWAGAFSLYISFVVMFTHILSLMSEQR